MIRPAAALALLAAAVGAALLARHTFSVAALALVLLAVCLRAPRGRRWPYLVGTGISAAALFSMTMSQMIRIWEGRGEGAERPDNIPRGLVLALRLFLATTLAVSGTRPVR